MMSASVLGLELTVDPGLKWGQYLLHLLADVIAQSSLDGPLHGELVIERGGLPRNVEPAPGQAAVADGVVDRHLATLVRFPARDRIVLRTADACAEWFSWCMQLSALRSDTTFVHAAGLEKAGNALLLAAPAGFGKTALTSDFVRRGYRLLGDDLTLLDRHGVCTGYPRALMLHPGHLKAFPELFAQGAGPAAPPALSRLLDWSRRPIKSLLRRTGLLELARRHHPGTARVLPSHAFGSAQLARAATLRTVVWLQRDAHAIRPQLRAADEIMPARLFANTLSEYDAHCISITNAAGRAGLVQWENLSESWLDILHAGLRSARSYTLSIPAALPLENLADVLLELLTAHDAVAARLTCV